MHVVKTKNAKRIVTQVLDFSQHGGTEENAILMHVRPQEWFKVKVNYKLTLKCIIEIVIKSFGHCVL